MRVAVTGATGFVGRHVVAALARRQDVEVVAASRRFVPADASLPSVRRVQLDIATPSAEDFALLDHVQGLFQELWDGEPCARCAIRDLCPDPGPYSRGGRS